MRLSFFKLGRRESAEQSPDNSSTTQAHPPSRTSQAKSSPSAGGVTAAPAVETGDCFEMPLSSLIPLLPATALKSSEQPDPELRVSLPLKQILPQLVQGRVAIPLHDVLARIPSELLSCPSSGAGTEKVSLPLEDVVTNLPPNLLQPRHDQREIVLDDDEFPPPFSEEILRARVAEEDASLWIEPAVEQEEAATTDASEQSAAPVTAQEQAAPPQSQAVEPEQVQPPCAVPAPAESNARDPLVHLPLASVVQGIPDNCLAEKRQALLERLDPSARVAVRLRDLVEQLGRGRIRLRAGRLATTLPDGIVQPAATNFEIDLAVEQVIEHVPASVFDPAAEQETLADGVEEIPLPFHEATQAEAPSQVEQAAASPPEFQTSQDTSGEVESPIGQTAETACASRDTIGEIQAEEVPCAEEQPSDSPPIEEELPRAGSEPIANAGPAAEAAEDPVELVDLDTAAEQESAPAPATEAAGLAPSKDDLAKALADLNSWTEEDLFRHNLGPTLSQRILKFRETQGGFRHVRELLQIAGIGPKVFERVLGFDPAWLDDENRAINRLLGAPEDRELSLQEIVRHASWLPGVEGCIVAMSDGLYLTGELPAHFDTQRVSAFAPQLFSRVAQYVSELNVGAARRFTVFTEAQPITIFKSGDLFFILIHKANRFSKALLNKCERISHELSRLCSKETAKP